MTLTQKLQTIRDRMTAGLVERDQAVRLALLALLSGEHLLLVGPPGTAKSMVARRLHHVVHEGSYFEHLLTRFTVPEELFGPLSVKALEQDQYRRQIERYLPTVSVAFLDEIFKANSAILNALLTLLNEREFDNGSERITTPLLSVVGASNELPDGSELEALYDRFLLRLYVGPVSDDAFASLLQLRGSSSFALPPSLQLSSEELHQIQVESQSVALGSDVVSLLQSFRTFLREEGIVVSDRRWRKIVKLLQVSAYSNGRSDVSVWDAWLLQHVVWSRVEKQPRVAAWYTQAVGDSVQWNPSRLTHLVSVWEQKLEQDQQEREPMRNEAGKRLFHQPDGSLATDLEGEWPQTRGHQSLYVAPGVVIGHQGRPLSDRTNDGRGYTLEELGKLQFGKRYREQPLRDWSGLREYLEKDISRLCERQANPPALQPRSFSPSYIHSRLEQLHQYQRQIEGWQGQLQTHVHDLETVLSDHLWIDSSFLEPARQALLSVRDHVDSLLLRLRNVHEGYNKLPVTKPMGRNQAHG
ncbi:MAG: ATPase [Deltaproteobacteria bacterium]|nr:MAG: ATPase [Deltaproteobacteria bacterium]